MAKLCRKLKWLVFFWDTVYIGCPSFLFLCISAKVALSVYCGYHRSAQRQQPTCTMRVCVACTHFDVLSQVECICPGIRRIHQFSTSVLSVCDCTLLYQSVETDLYNATCRKRLKNRRRALGWVQVRHSRGLPQH